MLKHLSARSESRNSYMSELEDSKLQDDVFDTSVLYQKIEQTNDGNKAPEVTPNSTTPSTTKNGMMKDGINIILTKPTIKKIIERRKSDIFLKDNFEKIKEEEIEKEEKSKEIIEEIQQENSKIIIHRRLREPSVTSSESGIASQVEEDTKVIKNTNTDQSSYVKDFWKIEEATTATPPLAFSSPKPVTEEEKIDFIISSSHQNIKSDIVDTRSSTPLCYATLGGLSRNKSEQFYSNNNTNNRLYHQISNQPVERHLSINIDTMHDYLDTKPIMPKHQRPQSVAPEMLRFNQNKTEHNQYKTNGRNLLVPAHREFNLLVPAHREFNLLVPAHREFNNNQDDVKKKFNRKNSYRGSTYSVSAGSSVSNVVRTTASERGDNCSCSIPGRRDLLEKITEEVGQAHEAFNAAHARTKTRIRKCKYIRILFVLFSAIACLLAGILHFYVGYFPQNVSLNQADIKLIHQSSKFCGSINGYSDNSNVRLITFKNNNKKKTLEYTRTEDVFVSTGKTWSRGFYLLKGSTINVTIASGIIVDVMTFIGEKNFTIWSQRKLSETYLKKTECCTNFRNGKTHILIPAIKDEKYFLAIYNKKELFPVSVYVELKFKRVTYDFSLTSSSCTTSKGKSCTVPYGFNNGEELAIEIPLGKTHNKISSSLKLEWKCEARIWFYCVFFAGIFIVLMIIIFIFYYIIVKICIPSSNCCCLRFDKRKQKKVFDYYDNYGRTNSDIVSNGTHVCGSMSHTYDKKQNIISNIHNGERRSLYGGVETPRSKISDSSQYLADLHQHGYQIATIERQKRQQPISNNNIATIYKEIPTYVETADSGISVEPDLSPLDRPSLSTHERIELQEMQFQHLKSLRAQQMQEMKLNDAPPVKQLLYRPRSAMSNPNGLGNNRSLYRPDNNNKGYINRCGILPDEKYISTRRPKSVMSEGDYFHYYNNTKFEPLNFEMTAGINYDDSEIYI